MRNELILPKFMWWTCDGSLHEAWGDSTNQTHHYIIIRIKTTKWNISS